MGPCDSQTKECFVLKKHGTSAALLKGWVGSRGGGLLHGAPWDALHPKKVSKVSGGRQDTDLPISLKPFSVVAG